MFKRIFFISLLILSGVLINLNMANARYEDLPVVINDTTGDCFGADILTVQAGSDSTDLKLRINFIPGTNLYDSANSININLGIDIDSDTTTGISVENLYGPNSSGQKIGAEYVLSIYRNYGDFNYSVNIFDKYFNFIGSFQGLTTFESIEITIPLNLLGNDDGSMNIVMRTSPSANYNNFDYAPDDGYGTVGQSLSSVFQVDDFILREVYGNGNGIPESNEQIALCLRLKNSSETTYVYNMQGTLSTASPYISYISNPISYFNNNYDSTIDNTSNPFSFQIGWLYDSSALPVKFSVELNNNGTIENVNFTAYFGIQKIGRSSSNSSAKISVDKIVWADNRNGKTDVRLYDLILKEEVYLPHYSQYYYDTFSYSNPDISGNKMVWQSNQYGNWNIFMYDLVSHYESVIPSYYYSNKINPAISGNKIVWQDDRSGNQDIYVYDLVDSTQETKVPYSTYGNHINPAIFGNKIVYQVVNSYDSGMSDIFMYDLNYDSAGETKIPPFYSYGNKINPKISGNKIVYQDNRNGNWDIYIYDLYSSLEIKIPACLSYDTFDQINPNISGNKIVYQDNREGRWNSYLYDLNSQFETKIPVQLFTDTADVSERLNPDVSGKNVIWTDINENISGVYMTKINVANELPVAVAEPKSWVAQIGQIVNFDGSGSYDNDGMIINYNWDFGDGMFDTGITVSHAYNSLGAYTATLNVVDNDSAYSIDSCLISVQNDYETSNISFRDDMENGNNGWVSNGLWHRETYRSNTLTTSWAYNTGSPDYNFNTGINSGSLMSPVIDIPYCSTATLNFKYFYQTESTGSSYDQRWVEILVDGILANSIQLYNDNMMIWNEYNLDLSPYTGKSVQIRFSFNSIDSVANNFEGWYIDDVKVYGSSGMGGNQPPVAEAGPDQVGQVMQPLEFNGSSSFDPDGGIENYEWNYGDGYYGTGAVSSHSYYYSGSYIVSLTVTDNGGVLNSDTCQVTITVPPLINMIIPDYGYNDTTSPISISGDNFDSTCKVYLGPDTAYLKGSVDTPGYAYGVSIYGNYAYVADAWQGVQIIDISNDSASIVRNIITNGIANNVCVQGNYLYVATSSGLQIMDLSVPDNPGTISNFSTSGEGYRIKVAGNYAYLVVSGYGLQIINISDPANPYLEGSFSSGYAMDVFVSGNYAYIADRISGLKIVNISIPANPALIGSMEIFGAWSVAVAGKYAYIGGPYNYMRVIDLSYPSSPAFVSNIITSDMIIRFCLSGKYLYAAGAYSGLYIFNLQGDPLYPALIDNVDTPGFAIEPLASGDKIYVADDIAGLQIVRRGISCEPVSYIDKYLIATYVPQGLTPGTYNVRVKNFQGEEAVYNNGFTVLEAFNYPPYVDAGQDQNGNKGIPLYFNGFVSDSTGFINSIEWDFGDGKFDSSGLSVSHVYDSVGMYNVLLRVYDDKGAEGIDSCTVNIINRSPVFNPIGNKTVDENGFLVFDVYANDPDGDQISFAINGLPSGASFDSVFVWTPNYSQSGTYNVTFNVSDGSLTASETIAITVNNVNRAPILNPIGNKTVNESQLLQFVVSGIDPDLEILSYTVNGLPAGAGFDTTTNTFVWTPNYSQSGTYNVTFNVSDGSLTDSESITITVQDVSVPDLIMTALSTVSTKVAPGSTLTVSNTAKNQGSIASGAFAIAFHLSQDTTYGGSDDVALTAVRNVSSLNVGASSTASTILTIPAGTPLGNYYICAFADKDGVISEMNELNNTRSTLIPIEVAGADLVMTAVSSPSIGITGKTIPVSSTVLNQGTGSISSFTIGIYLSSDAAVTTSDTRIGTRTVSSLNGGAYNTASTSLLIPASLTGGIYYIGAIADYNSTRAETDETNNALAGNTIDIASGFDAVMTAVSGPSSGATGTSISVISTVKNQGIANMAASYVGLYISTDPTITTSDTRLGTAYIASLAAGVSSYATTSVAISSTFAPGQYYIGAIADYSNAIKESDETNNALAGNAIDITAGADAVVTAVSGPASGATGTSISITITVKNQGVGAISTSTAGIYISTDETITTSDTRLGTAAIASLAAGVSSTVTTSLAISSTFAPGQYYIGVIADYNNARKESDETNNVLLGNTIDVTPGADAIITAVSGPLSGVTGTLISITSTVKNQGIGTISTSTAGIYISTDATITTSDTRLGTAAIASLAAGASSTVTKSFVIPSTKAAGIYYIGVIADYNNARKESDETNNALTGNTINLTKP